GGVPDHEIHAEDYIHSMALGFGVRRSAYFDSVALMRIAEQARALPDVADVALVMGTVANRAMLAGAGMLPAGAPDRVGEGLLVVVGARPDAATGAALDRVEALLDSRREVEPDAADVAPRTVTGAARRTGRATVAVVAVPGPYAALEAHEALS